MEIKKKKVDCERICDFFAVHVNLKQFCFFFSNRHNGEYNYKNVDANNDGMTSMNLVELAIRKGELAYLVFYLVLFWFEKTQGKAHVLMEEHINEELYVCYTKFMELEWSGLLPPINQPYSERCRALLKKIVPGSKPSKKIGKSELIEDLIRRIIDFLEKGQNKAKLFLLLLKIIRYQYRENKRLISKIKELGQAVAQSYKVIAETKDEEKRLKSKVKGLEQELVRSYKLIEEIKGVEKRLKIKIVQLEQELAQSYKVIAETNDEEKRLKSKIKGLEQELTQSYNVIAETRDEEKRLKIKIQQLEQERTELSQVIEKLEHDKMVLMKEVRVKEQQIESLGPSKKYKEILKSVLHYARVGLLTSIIQVSGGVIMYPNFGSSFQKKLPANLASTEGLAQSQHAKLNRQISSTICICVGIDLGTTYSSIATPQSLQENYEYIEIESNISILKDDNKQYCIPSVIMIDEKGAVQVGQPAKGRVGGIGKKEQLLFGKSGLLPERILVEILCHLKKMMEKCPVKIDTVVISVPANFKRNQRKKMRKAARRAGLKAIELIEDPIAAALMYYQGEDGDPTVLTYDLGGGTFEATILTKEKDSIFKIDKPDFVICAPHINGENIDKRLAEWIVDQLRININPDSFEMKKLLVLAEKVKISLIEKLRINHPESIKEQNPESIKEQRETSISFTINLETFEGLIEDNTKNPEEPDNPASLIIDLETFEGLIEEDIDETIEHCRELQNKALKEIDDILLVGGNTYIPLVSRKLKEAFDIEPKLKRPELCVAAGAAIMASNRIKANSYLTN